MRYTPRPRVTALTFLLLGLVAGSAPPTLAAPAKPPAPAPQADAGDLPVVEGGRATGQKTAEAARHDGLTVLDLSDGWLPSIFSETPDKPEPLRPFLIDLANEKFRSGGKYSRAREDRYFEVFGIPPSLNLLRRRIADRRRHACHARVKDGVLEQLSEKNVIPAEEAEKVPNPALAPGEKPTEDKPSMIYTGRTVSPRPLTALEHRAVIAMQAHLRCEDLLSGKANAGRMDRRTVDGLQKYQRLQTVGDSGNVDLDTRTALLGDSREQDFRALFGLCASASSTRRDSSRTARRRASSARSRAASSTPPSSGRYPSRRLARRPRRPRRRRRSPRSHKPRCRRRQKRRPPIRSRRRRSPPRLI